MSFIISNLSFGYEESVSNLFENVNLVFQSGWTAFAGANGSGKTSLALLASGRLRPDCGSIQCTGSVFYCPQLFEGVDVDDYQYIYDYSSSAMALKRLLGLDDDIFSRDELSGGERKRVQIYLALSRQPDVLILDEPTNHLDGKNRKILLSALGEYEGTGILISHDRAFMDALAKRTLIFSSYGPDSPVHIDDIPLPASDAFEELERRRSATLSQRSLLSREVSSLKGLERGLGEKIASSASRLSKKGFDAKDHDGKGKVDAARLSGKDRRDGDRKKAIQSRREDVEAKLGSLDEVRLRKSGLASKAFDSVHSALVVPPCDISVPGYTVHCPGLEFPPSSRTAIVGENGAGKSLFISHLVSLAREKWGDGKVSFVKQEYSAEDEGKIMSAFSSLDDDERSEVVSDLYRLGSAPSSFLGGSLSPGELRKLDFLLALRTSPSFLVMDEPGNHLDITSLMAMEEVLSSKSLTLVLVSHDEALRMALCERTVVVERHGDEGFVRAC